MVAVQVIKQVITEQNGNNGYKYLNKKIMLYMKRFWDVWKLSTHQEFHQGEFLQSCFVGRKGKTKFSMMNHSNSKLMITKSVKFSFVCA